MANSTFSGNSAWSGGGIANYGALTVTNSTLADNSSYAGGGIYNATTLTVTNSTLSGNSGNLGGGIANAGDITVTNSIIAGNTATSGPDIFGYVSGSDNLIGDGTGILSVFPNNVNGNQVGTTSNPINALLRAPRQ